MSKKIFITGATGFVGNAVARKLLQKGHQVKALYRKNANLKLLEDLDLELVEGDLRDSLSLKKAIQGCYEVFHVAAQYTFFNPQPSQIYQSNVQGTKNLLEICSKLDVQKIVYTSTVGAIGLPKNGGIGNEETPISLKDCQGHYKKSKFLAEQEALKFAKQGLPLIIVNPSAPVGQADIKPTPTGKMIVDFLNGKMPAYLDTGLNLVDVEDVATGHLLAAQLGKVGERYILGNQNLHLKDIFKILSHLTGLPSPKYQIPYSLAWASAWLVENSCKLFGKIPPLQIEAVELAKKMMFFDPSKAVNELGLPQTPVKNALGKAISWYLKNGYVKEKFRKKIDLSLSNTQPQSKI